MFIILHHAYTIALNIYLAIGTGNIVNIGDIAKWKEEYCSAILGLYVLTGEDVTIPFKDKDKVGPLEKLH